MKARSIKKKVLQQKLARERLPSYLFDEIVFKNEKNQNLKKKELELRSEQKLTKLLTQSKHLKYSRNIKYHVQKSLTRDKTRSFALK